MPQSPYPSVPERPKPYVPPRTVYSEFPLIDTDPHFSRVIRYARPADYGKGALAAAAGPLAFWLMERFSPAHVGKGGFASVMRLTCLLSAGGGFLLFYQNSTLRFYGWKENGREVERDMREMVDKVKKGEPLYGRSTLTPYMQGVAARNSRYTGIFLHVIPWFNFVNHEQHGVDTAKYYQQAERELEEERLAQGSGLQKS